MYFKYIKYWLLQTMHRDFIICVSFKYISLVKSSEFNLKTSTSLTVKLWAIGITVQDVEEELVQSF